uniref:Uncharacterized protein n=1 Tax=Acrobeloides nanus TaxID=290746 RepID=A0A914C9T8_9BILA
MEATTMKATTKSREKTSISMDKWTFLDSIVKFQIFKNFNVKHKEAKVNVDNMESLSKQGRLLTTYSKLRSKLPFRMGKIGR